MAQQDTGRRCRCTAVAAQLFRRSQRALHPAAEAHLQSLDVDRLASLTQASVHLVREKGAERDAPVSIVGLSMGASLGLWASIRIPDAVSRVVSFYGTQTIDFTGARADYQLHFADDDELVDSDEAFCAQQQEALGKKIWHQIHYKMISL